MAGSITVTRDKGSAPGVRNSIRRIDIAWTSDAAGAVSGNEKFGINGRVMRMTTVPSGSAAPTNLYDITILDSNSVDILKGVGADRSSSATEDVAVVYSGTSVHPAVSSACTLVIAAAGNAKSGTISLYYQET